MNYVQDKVILVTGAASGFGRLTSDKAAALGAKLVCVDVNADALIGVVEAIKESGGEAIGVVADVADIDAFRAAVSKGVKAFGRLDVLVNNAGTMPLAFISDHAAALSAWNKCIDVNFRGVINGTAAVYDQMVEQGGGQIVNVSSIYGNHPVIGSGVYGATKAAVNYFSNSVRQESRGKIKVSVVKPTGVIGTNLGGTVINPMGLAGILAQNAPEFHDFVAKQATGELDPSAVDPESLGYQNLDQSFIAEAIVHVINQPLGVTLSEITVRASSDPYIL
jgi:NADP-dependent 3-hydroxy acid dehydrogenase YdfG